MLKDCSVENLKRHKPTILCVLFPGTNIKNTTFSPDTLLRKDTYVIYLVCFILTKEREYAYNKMNVFL